MSPEDALGELVGPLPGHGLVHEGAAFYGRGQRVSWNSTGGTGYALCSCGAASPVLSSGAARKRWHRQHKYAVSTQ